MYANDYITKVKQTASIHTSHNTGLEVLTEVVMKRSLFWNITSWSHVESNKGYRRICRLHILADFLINLSFEPDHRGDIFLRNVGWFSTDYMVLYPRRWTVQKSYKIISCYFTLRPRKWKRYIPPPRRTLSELHSVTIYKTNLHSHGR
jgi:hypothetical protein